MAAADGRCYLCRVPNLNHASMNDTQSLAADSGSPVPEAQIPFSREFNAQAVWPAIAKATDTWMKERGISARDSVVLLPFAQHLALARKAWAGLGRWAPRLETTRSWASSLGPTVLAKPGEITFDAAIDALAARTMLEGFSWAQVMNRSDPRAFRLAITRFTEAAHGFAQAAASVAPAERAAYWDGAREALAQQAGPASLEKSLSLAALEWAASSAPTPATDACFELTPSALVQVQAGGSDRLANALLANAAARGVPVYRIVLDAPFDEALQGVTPMAQVSVGVTDQFEEQAQLCAAAVVDEVLAGHVPVAVAATDRVLLRRVRALLDRAGAVVSDETGWTLATAPAAAQIGNLLQVARHDASLDDWLAWLKTGLAQKLAERAGPGSVEQLEKACRARAWSRPAEVRAERLPAGAAQLWASAQEHAHQLVVRGEIPLAQWIDILKRALYSLDGEAVLSTMSAGPDVLSALWLSRQPWQGSAHDAVLQQTRVDQAGFAAWVTETLEDTQSAPSVESGADVIITPLARTMLRPFGAVVIPSADASNLGQSSPGMELLGDATAKRAGLPTRDDRRLAAEAHLLQALRAPRVIFLRSKFKGKDPLAPSPLLERLAMAMQSAGLAPMAALADPRAVSQVSQSWRPRATASGAGLLPRSLSASAVEALRDCPYKFFSRVLLGLGEDRELDAEADKRDYGNWLHAVLHDFHVARQARDAAAPSLTLAEEHALLDEMGEKNRRMMGLTEAEFMPYLASFGRFKPAYLAWALEREASGNFFHEGEAACEVKPWADHPELAELALAGRIDRIDRDAKGHSLLDYKTGSAKSLSAKVASPLEDTQLAVYGVLMRADVSDAVHSAGYIALDQSGGKLVEVVHEDVGTSAATLVAGLAEDLKQIQRGDSMPALGEGTACQFCEMRGLCRRDEWEGQ